MHTPTPARQIDGTRFREVLGSYPTGVAIVTCTDEQGRPAGMVIGTFTSVSLDPPLIGYLPMKTSRTFARMRGSPTFCVNILAADQESVCQHFASAAEDKFAGLAWHPSPAGNPVTDPYLLGIFLMGAYQDIMGDLHNLFGRVNEVHVFLDPDEPAGYYVEEIIEGATIVEALKSVQYDENELKRQMKAQMDAAIKSDKLKPSEAMRLLDEYEKGLKEYTYLTTH